MTRVLAVLVVLIVLAGACSSTSDDERAVEAVAEGLLADEQFTDVGVTEDEATCVGEMLTERLGAEEVLAMETDSPDFIASLNQVEIDAMGEGLEECVSGIEELTVDALATDLQEDAVSGVSPTAEQSRCVAEAVVGEISLPRLIVIGRSTVGADLSAMTESEARAYGDAYVSCTEFRAAFLAQVEANGANPEQVECFDREVSDEDRKSVV